ncbi:MAG TPA: hypothetical protein VN961_21665, partial [Streptosporangiaceae bacterium]|nr:hypothetical protein [Streptosporangiaceae bacterium]
MATSPPGGTEIVLAPADAGRLCRDAGLQHLLTPAWQDCLAGVALFYGVDRSTITRAVGEVRPLLAARGFAVPGERGLRLRTL